MASVSISCPSCSATDGVVRTNGIRIVRWVIARHGNICGSGLVMG
ncbi:hypothetical protein FHA92_16995 [Escherichia coli]|nr:hypothetical protein [Escherichia coli]